MERETVSVTLPISGKVVTHFSYLKAKEFVGLTKAEDPMRFLIDTIITDIDGVKEKDAYVRIQVQELRSLFRRDPKNVGTRRANKATVSAL